MSQCIFIVRQDLYLNIDLDVVFLLDAVKTWRTDLAKL